MPEATVQRIVPGAPPPAPLSKSQKKKRKGKKTTESTPESPTAAPTSDTPLAVVEKAPESVATREGSVAPEPVTQPESLATPAPEEELGLKLSPIVDLIAKRLKATTKKIVRDFGLKSPTNFVSTDQFFFSRRVYLHMRPRILTS
jgi:hypothetical protein